MKTKEIYEKYKQKYQNKIVFIKNGQFYSTFDGDACIMNYLLSYYIHNNRVGFPKNKMNDVKKKLRSNRIEYIFISEYKIADNYNYDMNKYQIILAIARENKYNNILRNNLMKKIKIVIKDDENYFKVKEFIDGF